MSWRRGLAVPALLAVLAPVRRCPLGEGRRVACTLHDVLAGAVAR